MIEVVNGVPQKDTIDEETWKFYYFRTSKDKDVYAVLVPFYGDPDLYIWVESDVNKNKEDIERPTFENFDVMSQDDIGADTALLD